MNKIAIIIFVVVAVSVVIVSTQLFPEVFNLEPKIYCSAQESGTSNWYKTEKNPVLTSYQFGNNFSSLPNAKLGVRFSNNNTKSLFNVMIEVSYLTINGNWNTTSKYTGFLDFEEEASTEITLMNPKLLYWDTEIPVYRVPEEDWKDVNVPYLDSDNFKITVYGFENT